MRDKLYLIGDIHADVRGLKMRLDVNKIEPGSGVILNGDVGLNYYGDSSDEKRKEFLSDLPYTFFCVAGNHEMRPWEAEDYHCIDKPLPEGRIYWQEKHPHILFLDDGVHHLYGKKILVLGGAYSVDKGYRLATGKKWWESEQMTPERRDYFLNNVKEGDYDAVVSHTCPYLARPLDKGLSFVDQSKVDSTMEVFLEHMRGQLTYKKWFASHWHIDEIRRDKVGEVHFVFEKLVEV